MTHPNHIRRALLAGAAMVSLRSISSTAQSPTGMTGTTRDSLFACASRMAESAGFRAAPGANADRVGLMRSRTSPGGTLVDGLRISMVSARSAAPGSLDVRVTTFLSSRTDPFSHQEMSPPRALTALADSIRMVCQPRR